MKQATLRISYGPEHPEVLSLENGNVSYLESNRLLLLEKFYDHAAGVEVRGIPRESIWIHAEEFCENPWILANLSYSEWVMSMFISYM